MDLVFDMGGFWDLCLTFLALLRVWACLMFCGMSSSKHGGKKGPDEMEEEEVWFLGLLSGPNLLEIEMGESEEFCIGLIGGEGPCGEWDWRGCLWVIGSVIGFMGDGASVILGLEWGFEVVGVQFPVSRFAVFVATSVTSNSLMTGELMWTSWDLWEYGGVLTGDVLGCSETHASSSSPDAGRIGCCRCWQLFFGYWLSSNMPSLWEFSPISIRSLQLMENRQSVKIMTFAQSKLE